MMLLMLSMAGPSAQSYREFDRGRRAAAHAIIKSGKGENALSPPGERGIVRPSSDLAPAWRDDPKRQYLTHRNHNRTMCHHRGRNGGSAAECAVERTVAGKCDTGTPRSDDDRSDRYLQTV